MCGTSPGLRKSWKKPHNLSPILAPAPGTPGNPGKTSQSADHPRDPENPGKNFTICGQSPGPLEILEKTSQSEPHPSPRPRDLWKSWKNLTICGPSPGPRKSWKKTSQYYGFACWLVVGVPTSCAEAPCGGKNVRGKWKSY